MKLEGTRCWCIISIIILGGLISTNQSVISKGKVAIEGAGVSGSSWNDLEGSRVVRKREVSPVTGEGAVGAKAAVTPPSVNATSSSDPAVKTSDTKSAKVKEKTLVIPDRRPVNFTQEAHIKDDTEEDEDNQENNGRPGQGNFDDKAVQRAIIVVAGIAMLIIAYLGVKFFLIKKRKVVKRYGRIEASEMDLLDEIEDDDESEEEEELFDINQQRRS